VGQAKAQTFELFDFDLTRRLRTSKTVAVDHAVDNQAALIVYGPTSDPSNLLLSIVLVPHGRTHDVTCTIFDLTLRQEHSIVIVVLARGVRDAAEAHEMRLAQARCRSKSGIHVTVWEDLRKKNVTRELLCANKMTGPKGVFKNAKHHKITGPSMRV
jgi:hypothetical protein